MRDIAIVTDSTSDMPNDLMAGHGIEVVPLRVTIMGDTFKDGEIDQEEFFEKMEAAPQLPTTSQPSVGEFVEKYREVLSNAREVVSVHLPDTISGTIESARQAAKQFGERIHVVDAHMWSGPLGLMALRAAELANRGAGAAEIVEAVESIRERSRIIIALDSLTNLAKGGRIGNATALIGGLLDIKVLITERDRMVQPVKRVRGSKRALATGMDWLTDQIGDDVSGRFWIGHAMAADKAEDVRRYIEKHWDASEVIMSRIGAVMSTHTGSGWGATFVPFE